MFTPQVKEFLGLELVGNFRKPEAGREVGNVDEKPFQVLEKAMATVGAGLFLLEGVDHSCEAVPERQERRLLHVGDQGQYEIMLFEMNGEVTGEE